MLVKGAYDIYVPNAFYADDMVFLCWFDIFLTKMRLCWLMFGDVYTLKCDIEGCYFAHMAALWYSNLRTCTFFSVLIRIPSSLWSTMGFIAFSKNNWWVKRVRLQVMLLNAWTGAVSRPTHLTGNPHSYPPLGITDRDYSKFVPFNLQYFTGAAGNHQGIVSVTRQVAHTSHACTCIVSFSDVKPKHRTATSFPL